MFFLPFCRSYFFPLYFIALGKDIAESVPPLGWIVFIPLQLFFSYFFHMVNIKKFLTLFVTVQDTFFLKMWSKNCSLINSKKKYSVEKRVQCAEINFMLWMYISLVVLNTNNSILFHITTIAIIPLPSQPRIQSL